MSDVVLIIGTVGAGKTTTAGAVGDLLAEQEVPHAVIDLDEIHRLWPAPPGDRFTTAVQFENLAAMARVYRRHGAQKLVLAGVLEGSEGRSDTETAVGEPVAIVRLKVDLAMVRERLHSRHEGGAGLDWHLERSGELDEILDGDDAADHTIRIADETPERVAARVLDALDW